MLYAHFTRAASNHTSRKARTMCAMLYAYETHAQFSLLLSKLKIAQPYHEGKAPISSVHTRRMLALEGHANSSRYARVYLVRL